MSTHPLLLWRRQGDPVYALRDGLSEKRFPLCRLMRDEVQLDGGPARALAVDSNASRVSPKRTDMRLRPAKRLDLVAESGVEVRGAELGDAEEAERVETIVDRDHHRMRALLNPVVERPVARIAENVAYRVYGG